MGVHQRDYILRLIERIAAIIARAMRRKNEGDAVGARGDLAQATADLLGPAGQMVPFVDVRTAVDLLSDAERVLLYARLLDADADLQDSLGLDSQRTRLRARELMREVIARGGELSDDLYAFAAELEAIEPLTPPST
jgi:hypothetical protein